MATLVDELVPDQLWAMVEPLLPVPPRVGCANSDRAYELAVRTVRGAVVWRLH